MQVASARLKWRCPGHGCSSKDVESRWWEFSRNCSSSLWSAGQRACFMEALNLPSQDPCKPTWAAPTPVIAHTAPHPWQALPHPILPTKSEWFFKESIHQSFKLGSLQEVFKDKTPPCGNTPAISGAVSLPSLGGLRGVRVGLGGSDPHSCLPPLH